MDDSLPPNPAAQPSQAQPAAQPLIQNSPDQTTPNIEEIATPVDPQVDDLPLTDENAMGVIRRLKNDDDEQKPTAEIRLTAAMTATMEVVANARSFFMPDGARPGNNTTTYYDGVFVGKLGNIMTATFYDASGEKLIADNPNLVFNQRIIPHMEHHMAHFALGVTAKPAVGRLVTGPVPVTASSGTANVSSTRIEVEDEHEHVFGSVFVNINYESYTSLVATDFGNRGQDLPPEHLQYLADLPLAMRTEIRDIQNSNHIPMLFEITFDHTKASLSRVYASVPEWGVNFAAAAKTNKMWAVCIVDEDTPTLIATMTNVFDHCKQKANNPLNQFHHPGRRWMFKEERININPGIAPDDFYFNPRYSFFSKAEYLTIWGVHILSEKASITKEINDFGNKHNVVFQQIPNAQDRAFFAYLKLPEGFRLSRGTKLRINFAEETAEHEPIVWNAVVISAEYGPSDHATMIVKRPWDATAAQFIGTVPRTITTPNGSVRDIQNAIMQDDGVEVSIQQDALDRIPRNLIHAVEDMNFISKGKEPTSWNNDIVKALLCNRFDDLPLKDAFAAVASEFPDVKTVMTLNENQRLAVDAMRRAPAGLSVINGPPGTGKSRILLETLKPFLRSKDSHCILIASASNSAVNAIAANMDALLKELQKKELVAATKYGLRAHSEGTETALRKKWADDRRPPLPNARPPVWETECIIETLDEINAAIATAFKTETYQTVEGINDSRLEHTHLSIGLKMLEIAGVISGPCTVTDSIKFADFRAYNQAYANGRTFSKDQLDTYKVLVNDLWDYTVRNASFIVGTTSNMGSYRLLITLKSVVRLVMIDEAAYEREDYLIPFFSAKFTQLDGFIQVGDWLKLLPMVTTEKEYDLFAEQSALSFMTRLISTGFPVYWLNEQHRMVEDIANLANFLTYEGRLVTMPDAKLVNRQVAQTFRKWAVQFVKHPCNFFMVNIVSCPANVTKFSSTQSRYNDLFIIIIGLFLRSIIAIHGQATIAVLTGYNAQKLRLLEMVKGLKRTGQANLERVTVDTFDASQGQQYDFVLMDVLIDGNNKKMGFQADRRRMNVAMTRARNGMVIFADINAIRSYKPKKRSFMAKFLNQMSSRAMKTTAYSSLPPVNFYQTLP